MPNLIKTQNADIFLFPKNKHSFYQIDVQIFNEQGLPINEVLVYLDELSLVELRDNINWILGE